MYYVFYGILPKLNIEIAINLVYWSILNVYNYLFHLCNIDENTEKESF